ncbi:MAG: hypothetical protein RIR07_208, partial [Bacteroidota bacterium]
KGFNPRSGNYLSIQAQCEDSCEDDEKVFAHGESFKDVNLRTLMPRNA